MYVAQHDLQVYSVRQYMQCCLCCRHDNVCLPKEWTLLDPIQVALSEVWFKDQSRLLCTGATSPCLHAQHIGTCRHFIPPSPHNLSTQEANWGCGGGSIASEHEACRQATVVMGTVGHQRMNQQQFGRTKGSSAAGKAAAGKALTRRRK